MIGTLRCPPMFAGVLSCLSVFMMTIFVSACGSGNGIVTQTMIPTPPIRQPEPVVVAVVAPTQVVETDMKTIERSVTIASTPIIPSAPKTVSPHPALDSDLRQIQLPDTNLIEGRILRAIPTRDLDSRQRPTDPISVFSVGERVYVSVEFVGIRSGQSVGVRWKKEEEALFTYEQPVGRTFTRGYFGFYFDPPPSNSAGSYSAEVLIEGVVVQAVGFWVSETIQGVPSG